MISNGDKYRDQPMHPGSKVGSYLPLVQRSSTPMEVGFNVAHVPHVSEAGWSELP